MYILFSLYKYKGGWEKVSWLNKGGLCCNVTYIYTLTARENMRNNFVHVFTEMSLLLHDTVTYYLNIVYLLVGVMLYS